MSENAIREASPRYYNGLPVRDNVNHTLPSVRGDSHETPDVNALPLPMTATSLITDSGSGLMILQLPRPLPTTRISLRAPPLSEHSASVRTPDEQPRLPVATCTLASRHEVVEARASDAMAARCRERKRSRGSHVGTARWSRKQNTGHVRANAAGCIRGIVARQGANVPGLGVLVEFVTSPVSISFAVSRPSEVCTRLPATTANNCADRSDTIFAPFAALRTEESDNGIHDRITNASAGSEHAVVTV